MERRLAAILAADMVGFSRLMEADEIGTLTRQKRHRAELIDPRIEAHGGKIIKLTGDGMIAEFPSVVEAVQCAVTIQREMDAREADEPEDRRIRYRIAVNLGDVIFDEGDVYGDGVNIAARLEALADPGGVLVSGSAYDQLKANIDVGYEDLGEKQVKNIETPVRVYRVVPDGSGTVVQKQPTRGRLPVLAAVVVTALLIAVGAWWWSERPEFTPADPSKMEFALEEPSIAVLAFNNLTGDQEQEHVSDGISEDIISTLARLPGVVVIARNSSFSYKGKPVDVRQIAEEMSVRYVLEGSLQDFGENIRVTAQLIDAVSGHHVWAKKFDRPREDFFKVRDEITYDIIEELNSTLIDGHTARASRASFKSVDAWLLGRKMLRHGFRFNRADNQIAIDIGHTILQIEPGSAVVHSLLAIRFAWMYRANWSDDPEEALRQAEAYAEKAISLESESSVGYSALGFVRYSKGHIKEAISLSKQALDRTPGDAELLALLGLFLQMDLQADRSVEAMDRALRANRNAPGWFWTVYGDSLRIAGNDDAAVATYLEASKRGAKGVSLAQAHLGLAVSYDALGRPDDARDQIAAAIEVFPKISVAFMRRYKPYTDQDYKDRWLATLKRLGLPED